MRDSALPAEETDTCPQVSVIIPLFNREKYIAQTIESIIGQRYPNLQLIVVDDGSTDGSTAITKQYPQITLIRHPNGENRGQSASINLGLSIASGTYIAVIDSDDYWRAGFLDATVEFLESNPDIGLVYVGGDAVSDTGEELYPMLPSDHVEPQDPSSVLLDCYFLLPGQSLVRHELYKQVGSFDTSFRASQDHDMCIRLAEVTKFAYLPRALFCYRQHGDSISVRSQRTRWTNGFTILRRAAQRYPYPRSVIRKRRAVLHYRMGQVMFSERSYLGGSGHWLISLLLDPVRAVKVLTGIDTSR